MLRAIMGLALLVALKPSGVQAQADRLQPGMRVRVIAPPLIQSRYDARIAARHGDTLTLVRGEGGWPLAVPLSSLTSVEVYMGKDRWKGARHSAVWGSIVGLAVGLLWVKDPGSTCGTDYAYSDVKCVYNLTLVGALYGATYGVIRGGDRWERLQVLTPMPGKAGQAQRP